MKDKLKKYLLPNLPYLFFVYLFDKFSLGCMANGHLAGVAIVGRPVSRYLDDGLTLEVNRLCTDGTKNACSFLYGAAARAAKVLGYHMKCGKCGYACNHVLYHKQPADKAYIECNKRKTKECDLLPIREVELKTIMEQVAGRRENVERIILYDGHIDFLMKDGTVKSHIRKYSGDGFYKTPFSRKIFCGYCGSSIVRMGGNKRRTCWMCSIKKTDKAGCEHELMSDGELYGAAQSILGTEENLDMEIYLHIEKTISYNDRIEFYMKEGGKKVWQRR